MTISTTVGNRKFGGYLEPQYKVKVTGKNKRVLIQFVNQISSKKIGSLSVPADVALTLGEAILIAARGNLDDPIAWTVNEGGK